MRQITVRELMDRLEKLHPDDPISILTECKACYKINDEELVRFYRIDRYEKKKVLKSGYKCRGCGYLNAED